MRLILLCDDDDLVAEIVRAALSPLGYIVGALPDARNLLPLVELKRPSLVILDCMMPGVPGLEALRQLRSSSTCFDVPVLMLTARATLGDEEIALRAGATDYLRKPFDSDQLITAVEFLSCPSSQNSSPSKASYGMMSRCA